MPYPGKTNTPYSSYGNKIFWKISNVVPTPINPQYAVSKPFAVNGDSQRWQTTVDHRQATGQLRIGDLDGGTTRADHSPGQRSTIGLDRQSQNGWLGATWHAMCAYVSATWMLTWIIDEKSNPGSNSGRPE
ncbi:hypothetical protein Tco_1280525 [Tanacetum coccineum]